MKTLMNIHALIFEICLILLICSVCLAKKCKKINSCSCKTDSGFVVDLSPISNTDNTPYFQDKPDRDKNSYYYSWNPCKSFTEGSCVNVAACSFSVSGAITQYTVIGDIDSSTFLYDSKGRLVLRYTESDPTVVTNVVLICKKSSLGDIIAYAEADDAGNTNYYLELSTKYACVHGGGLSVGSIILIAVACSLLLYIIIGIAIQVFVKKESGRKILPNYEFWNSARILIKDGVVFVAKRGKNVNYDKI